MSHSHSAPEVSMPPSWLDCLRVSHRSRCRVRRPADGQMIMSWPTLSHGGLLSAVGLGCRRKAASTTCSRRLDSENRGAVGLDLGCGRQ